MPAHDQMTAEELEHAPSDWLSPTQLANLKRPLTEAENKRVADDKKKTDVSKHGGVDPEEGLLEKKIAGPVKVWHALVGAVATALGGLAYHYSKKKKR